MSQIFFPRLTNIVSEEPDLEIDWTNSITGNSKHLLGKKWRPVANLEHRSNPASGDLRNRTRELWCTDFQFTGLPAVITGLELTIIAQRNGRVMDEIVQLVYQGQKIGNNNFFYEQDPEGGLAVKNNTQYGGPTDLWGVELTKEMLEDPSFGVVLKFCAHSYYPHRSGFYLDTVSLTVY